MRQKRKRKRKGVRGPLRQEVMKEEGCVLSVSLQPCDCEEEGRRRKGGGREKIGGRSSDRVIGQRRVEIRRGEIGERGEVTHREK